MCGFAGEFVFVSGRADADLARRMAARLIHRGPDEQGAFLSADGRCAMGFRRLAVIDPPGSHQPMSSEDGRLTIAFNGEIYNFQALRSELSGQGVNFRTAGDTEVLLQLYHRDGLDMFDRLEGMFAFVLFDSRAGRVLLARDRLGQKPLWYTLLPDRVVFASEAKALLAHPQIDRQVDSLSVTHYMTSGYIPSPRSIWRGVRKLPPAHWLVLPSDGARPQPYWQPQAKPPGGSGRDLVLHVRQSLTDAVASHMVSDVPLGALLSGGIDSAVVVALMSRAAGAAGGVRTFTASFDEPEFDESAAACKVAAHCGTDHTELPIRPLADNVLDELVAMYDEPFADSSALPTLLICRAARRHVTVALTGDGGDEVFAGYDRYRAMHLGQTLRPWEYLGTRIAAAVLRPWAGHNERNRARRFLRFADSLTYPPPVQYFTLRRLFGPDGLARLLTDDYAAQLEMDAPVRWFCDLYEGGDCNDDVARAQRHDMLTYLPDDLLVKTDIASMACSLELRAPMLDHRLIELGLSLPGELKLDRRRGKKVLREAFGDMLPASVFRRPKRGFAVPLGRWLRRELRQVMLDTLLDPAFLRRGIFRRDAIEGLINDHLSGRDDHRHRLWALLVLARWLALQNAAV
ncbi:MAG: asparagine synthase (glutamine-hydrolyzing) [Planctomycetota bacterium]|nr:asparagine synthase (glutamine-hydrolyzing) [Planctomycetota bacterium]